MSVMEVQQPVKDAFANLGMMLHDAVRDRNISGDNGINMLMQFSPPVDFLDNHHNTPLHQAVHSGYVAGVESLLKYNADVVALDSEWGFSSENLSLKVIEIQEGGKMYKSVPTADLMASYRLLVAASSMAYNQNDSDWDIQLRPNDRVEVHDMRDGDMPVTMNGTVGILQHYIAGPDAEHPADGTWRVGFSHGLARGPAFLHARHLRRV